MYRDFHPKHGRRSVPQLNAAESSISTFSVLIMKIIENYS